MPERIQDIKAKVQNYYMGKIDGKGELNKAEVLKYMQTEEFIKELTQWYELSEVSSVKKIIKAVATKFVQRDKENESKCQGFVDTISDFTNGFDFLVSDIESYKAMRGAKESKKLPSIEEYNRMLGLKTKINTIMQSELKTEAEAIRDLLSTQKSNVQLKTEEAMILRRRIDVIDGKVKTASRKEEKSFASKAQEAIDKVGNRTNLSGSAGSKKNIPSYKKPTEDKKAPEPVRNLKSVQDRLNNAKKRAEGQGKNTLESISRAGKSARTR